MNIFVKIYRWLFGKKKKDVPAPVEQLAAQVDFDELRTEQSFEPPKIKRIKLGATRSMTTYERQIYYGMGYKQFEKYKRSL